MGIEIKTALLKCDYPLGGTASQKCSEALLIDEISHDFIESAGWSILPNYGAPIEEWRVFCPKHKEEATG